MLKAWNTGHPGGIATVHANSALSALYRVEQLVQEAVVSVPRSLIADAIDLIVFIAGRGLARRIETIARVVGLDPADGYGLIDITPTAQTPRERTLLRLPSLYHIENGNTSCRDKVCQT